MNIHVYQIIKIPDMVFLIPCYPPKVKYVCFIGSFSSAKPKGRANGPYEVKVGEGSRCGCWEKGNFRSISQFTYGQT